MAFDRVTVLADREALARYTADWLLAIAASAGGSMTIALAGGATPRRTYETLAESSHDGRFPWHTAHWFWGDERCVPRDDPRSNYRMVSDALLSRVAVPAANVHPVPTASAAPVAAAKAYARELKRHYGADELDPARPFFDVVLLGLGADGHTASLFPGSSALDERKRWVAAVDDAQPEPRVTLTYPLLNSCRHAVFLVAGADKRDMLRRLRRGDAALPAAGIHPSGQLYCFADAAAAGPSA